jgi:hypothetical protein
VSTKFAPQPGAEKATLANILVNDLRDRLGAIIQSDTRFQALTGQDLSTNSAAPYPWPADINIPVDPDVEDWYTGYTNIGQKTYEFYFDIVDGEPVLTDDAPVEVEAKKSYSPVANEAQPKPGTTPQDTENEMQDLAKAKKAADDAKEATAAAHDATQVAGEADTQEAHGAAAKAHLAAVKANNGAAKAYGDNKFMSQVFSDRADGHQDQADAHQKEADTSDRSSKNLSLDAKQASTKAMAASKYALAGDAPEPHGIAQQENEAAAAAHKDAATALRPSDPMQANFHDGQALMHKENAKFHATKAGTDEDLDDDDDANEAKVNESFWRFLRIRLGAKADTGDMVEPDAAIDTWIANHGGEDASRAIILANDSPQAVKLGDKDLGPQFLKIQQTDNDFAKDAIAASNAAFDASSKIRALGKNANAQDYAALADAHLAAAAAHTGRQWDNPELMDAAATVAQAHTAFGRDALTAEQSAVDQMQNRKSDLDKFHAYVTQANSAIAMSTQVAGVKAHQDNVADEMEKFMPTAEALTSKEQNDAKALILKLRSGKGQPLQGVASLVGGAASNEILANGGPGSGPRAKGDAAEMTRDEQDEAETKAHNDAYEAGNKAHKLSSNATTPAENRAAAVAHDDAADMHAKAYLLHKNSKVPNEGIYHAEQASAFKDAASYHRGRAAGHRFKADAQDKAAANEGTSEGATKGWQTRHAGVAVAAGKADDDAHVATHKAWAAGTPEAHDAAEKAHLDSATAQRAAGKVHGPEWQHFHEAQAKGNEATAKYHHDKASELRDTKKKATFATPSVLPKVAAPAQPRANEADPANLAALEMLIANEGQVIEFPNEFQIEKANESDPGSNWVMISPYGDWPHTGGIQRFTKQDANEIVKDFNGIVPKVMRMGGLGVPFYIGHPDHEAFKTRYTDTKAYGRIKEMQARDDGLWGNVKWSSAGKLMVNEEMFHGHSVNWRVRKDKDGFWRPYSVKSVGFTNEPNINVPPITHANEGDPDIENDLQRIAA